MASDFLKNLLGQLLQPGGMQSMGGGGQQQTPRLSLGGGNIFSGGVQEMPVYGGDTFEFTPDQSKHIAMIGNALAKPQMTQESLMDMFYSKDGKGVEKAWNSF